MLKDTSIKVRQQLGRVFYPLIWPSITSTVLQTLCFRGKCLLTCLYGRVEVMGFTIEEGQQSYPLFSPASHCPLSIRALESSDQGRDDKAEASPVLRKYLQPGKRISRLLWCHYHTIISPYSSDTILCRVLVSWCIELFFSFLQPAWTCVS